MSARPQPQPPTAHRAAGPGPPHSSAMVLERFNVPDEKAVLVPVDSMRAVVHELFLACGLDQDGAATCADVLIANDLRGNESHGVSNQLRAYVTGFQRGVQNARPDFKILRETPATAVVDADSALGIHVGPFAMRLAVEKAKQYGVGTVTVFNHGHLGGAGYHAKLAADAGCIGHCLHGPGGSQVYPTFGAEPRFGTHPIAWAAPAGKEEGFLFDISTAQVAGNKMTLARRLGVQLAENWIVDDEGTPIDEEVDAPMDASKRLLPFGGTREQGSHKSYGLACMIDIMSNCLTGVGPGFVTGGGGSVFTAHNIEAFTDRETYDDWADQFLAGLRTTPPSPGNERVLYPGLLGAELTRLRQEEGIPYHPEVLNWFESIAAELGHDGLAGAVAGAWPPLELSAEEKAEYDSFQVIANGGQVLTETQEQDEELQKLGMARGGVRLSGEEQAKFAGRGRL